MVLGKAIYQGAVRNFKLKMRNILANVSVLQDIVVHLLSCHEAFVLQQEWRKGERCTVCSPIFYFETQDYFKKRHFRIIA